MNRRQEVRPIREEDIEDYKPELTPWIVFSIIGGVTLYYAFTLLPSWGAAIAAALTFRVLWSALKSELAGAKRFYFMEIARHLESWLQKNR